LTIITCSAAFTDSETHESRFLYVKIDHLDEYNNNSAGRITPHTLHCNASRETMLNFEQIKMFFTRKKNKIEELR